MSLEDYAREFDSVYNESPWVAEAVVVQGPNASVEALAATMREAGEAAGDEQKLALTRARPDLALNRARPDLGGKLARRRELSDHSTREPSRLGPKRLEHSVEQEHSEALRQIHLIAEQRLLGAGR